MPQIIRQDDFEKEVLQSDIPVLVDFYSDSCVPCKRVAPVLSELEEKYTGIIKIVKINVMYAEDIISRYTILTAPTLALFYASNEIGRLKGAVDKKELEQWLDNTKKTWEESL